MTLTFRAPQLAELSRVQFEGRLIDAIAELDPDAGRELRSPEGRRVFREQCDTARQYGLDTEFDVARYVVTAWLLGTDFDTRLPAMQQVLVSDRLRPAQKADAIEKIAIAVLQELTGGRS